MIISDIVPGYKFSGFTVIKEGPSRTWHGFEKGKPRISNMRYFWCECHCGHSCKLIPYTTIKHNEIRYCEYCKPKYEGHKRHLDPIEVRQLKLLNLKGSIHYYRAYKILTRCNNPKSDSYKYYGARGIKCLLGNNVSEVIKSIEKIDGYFVGAQLDRIDNNGHYELGNLRWVTNSENQMNKRTSVTIESLAIKPRLDKDVKQICERHNWNYDDFYKVKVDGTRNKWVYIAKINYNE